MNCACMSVAKPGYSSVSTFAATSFFAARTRSACSLPFAFDISDAGTFLHFLDDRAQVMRLAMRQQQLSSGDCARHQEGAGFDAVGNDRVRRAVQPFHALHANRRRAVAFDFRAHLDQQFGEIGNFRFERAVFENRLALGQHRSSEDVFRPRNRDLRKAEGGSPAQPR